MNSRCFLVLSLTITLLSAFGAYAGDAPAHGSFDWHKLFGRYEYITCQNSGSPIWQTDPSNQYILISDDPFNTGEAPENYLEAALFHEPLSPIVPVWELADMDQGLIKRFDDKTGELLAAHENYSTAYGVYSHIEWHYGEDSGWANFSFSLVGASQLLYTMDRHDELSGNTRHESCRLVKVE